MKRTQKLLIGTWASILLLAAVLYAVYHKDLERLRTYQNPTLISPDSLCVITGHIEGYGFNSIGLTYTTDSGKMKTIHIDHHNGNFLVKLKIGEPGFAHLSYNQYNWLPKYGKHSSTNFVVQAGTVIYVEGRVDSLRNLRVIGSPLTAELDSLNKAIQLKLQEGALAYSSKIKQEHSGECHAIMEIKDTVLQKQKWLEFSDKYCHDTIYDYRLYTEYIKSHPSSVISAFELSRLYSYMNPEELMAVYDSLDSTVKRHSYAIKFKKMVEAFLQTQVGTQAPDISLPDVNGKFVKLSSLKGKIVLLDFWREYDSRFGQGQRPSDLTEIYKQFHAKGFDIYAVSSDHNRKTWLETIQKENLAWINVLDTNKYPAYVCSTVYGVYGSPNSILIDRDGKIIERDLRSTHLKDKLAALLP